LTPLFYFDCRHCFSLRCHVFSAIAAVFAFAYADAYYAIFIGLQRCHILRFSLPITPSIALFRACSGDAQAARIAAAADDAQARVPQQQVQCRCRAMPSALPFHAALRRGSAQAARVRSKYICAADARRRRRVSEQQARRCAAGFARSAIAAFEPLMPCCHYAIIDAAIAAITPFHA